MKFPSIALTQEQQRFVESIIPSICERGGWELRTCAAGPDHVHVLLDVDPKVHGEKVRRLLKRWIGQELSQRWPRPDGASWWAEEGSNLAVHDHEYLNRAYPYVKGQRATLESSCAQHGAEDGPARAQERATLESSCAQHGAGDGPARGEEHSTPAMSCAQHGAGDGPARDT